MHTEKTFHKKEVMAHESRFLISLVLFLLAPLCASISTIFPNHPIKDGDLLVSEGKAFALGFFRLGKSSNRYVGIWYNNIPEQTIVWVANRDNPINNTTGVLSINNAGNLAIHDSNKKALIWSTNVSVAATGNSTYSAQLLDSGNLVLFHGDLDNKVVAWQSFDYPSNTMVPYMKLGIDRKAGLNRFLTSWKSEDDPGTGEYVYKFDFTTSPPQLFMYKGMVPYWRTGHWNGLKWSGVPQMNFSMFNVTYVENKDEVFVVDYLFDASIISRMIVNEFGILQRQIWNNESQWVEYYSAPNDLCDYYNHCGPYGNCDNSNPLEFECKCLPGYEPRSIHNWYLRDGSGGCMPKRGSKTCHSGEGFVKLTSVKLPDTSTGMVNRSVGLRECEEECIRNCSCTGYAVSDISKGTGCLTWHGKLVDTRQFSNGGQDFNLRVDAAELAEYLKSQQSDHGKKGIQLAKILAPSAAAVVFVTILLFYCLVVRKKKVSGTEKGRWFSSNANPTSVEASTYDNLFDESGTNTDLPFLDLSTIVAATDNFSFVNKLGQGGFGTVYKGRLHNGQEIAVKRLAKNSGQGAKEFKNEVTLIAKLQHRNLVRLLGFCAEKEENMLIYEYLPNKGLDSFIFDKNSRSLMDWRKRFDIVMGIARGLLYLHQDSRLRIIHRDLKASNVLLDGEMNPKISDFGMARIFGGDQIEANTNRVVGTYGYMAPEYAMEGLFSIKSDVFSFGVLLLEIISGRKNSSYYQDNSVNLIGHAWSLWMEDKALQVVDPLLGNSYSAHEVLRCLHVGFLCVQESAADRPTMSHVAFMLSHETPLPSPKQPAFTLKTRIGQDSSSTSVGASSANDVTLSLIKAR